MPLTEQLGDAVTFEEKNAQGDSNTCSTIINGFVSDNVDLILANATPRPAGCTGRHQHHPGSGHLCYRVRRGTGY